MKTVGDFVSGQHFIEKGQGGFGTVVVKIFHIFSGVNGEIPADRHEKGVVVSVKFMGEGWIGKTDVIRSYDADDVRCIRGAGDQSARLACGIEKLHFAELASGDVAGDIGRYATGLSHYFQNSKVEAQKRKGEGTFFEVTFKIGDAQRPALYLSAHIDGCESVLESDK